MSNFSEAEYLIANPDVADAVKNGHFTSGLEHYQLFGKQENRNLVDEQKSRRYKALINCNTEGLGLEIGPSFNPIAPKSRGYNIHTLDHLSKDELKDKYKGEGVPISNIEDVDFIWKGEKLADLIGKQHCYDYILAAHVIEHVPDFISFMQDCEKLLSTEGSLSLIIPDMRWCFDSLGEITTTGKILDAFDSQRTCPTRGQIFDSFANSCRLDDTISWGHERQGKLSLIHELEEAKDQWVKLSLEKSYIDVHCWHFIPESFSLIMSDLHYLNLTNFTIINQHMTVGCEFFVTLSINRSFNKPMPRVDALKEIKIKLNE